jgi:hypothetical protein
VQILPLLVDNYKQWLLDISRKQCINLDYFVGAKRLGRQFDGKIRDMPIPNASPWPNQAAIIYFLEMAIG